jgi:predicted RNA-binding Zn-ribbon protein involved in translation (DUF1610 family)
MKVQFECPECDGTEIEEIMEDVIVATVVAEITPNGDLEYTGQEEKHGGIIVRYQCIRCGWMIPDIKNGRELWDYLNKATEKDK